MISVGVLETTLEYSILEFVFFLVNSFEATGVQFWAGFPWLFVWDFKGMGSETRSGLFVF